MTGLRAAAEAYERSRVGLAQVRLVPFPAADPAATLWSHLRRPSDPEAVAEDPFETGCRAFRRAMWLLHTSLLPPAQFDFPAVARRLAELAERTRLVAGEDRAARLAAAASCLEALSSVTDSPLALAAATAISEQGAARVLVAVAGEESSQHARRWLNEAGLAAGLVVRHQLAECSPAGHLVAIGAVRWYPPALVTAPKAMLTEFIQYDWLGKPSPIAGLLPVSATGVSRPLIIVGSQRAPLIDPADLPPSPNWTAIRAQAASLAEPGDEADQVLARPVLLSGDHAVLLPSEPGSEVTCAVPSDGRIEVDRIPVAALEPGTHLVLRTQGGDADYIRELADRRFGAGPFRSLLDVWKIPLRKKLGLLGTAQVQQQLRAKGIRTKNVKYWASADCIRLQSSHDFQVLLEYLGLSDQGARLLAASERVFEAHIQAGLFLRKQLERLISRVDLSSPMDIIPIELAEGDEGGELSIFRVLQVAPQEFLAPVSAVKHPYPVSEAAWLA
jgi:hypothetical protein